MSWDHIRDSRWRGPVTKRRETLIWRKRGGGKIDLQQIVRSSNRPPTHGFMRHLNWHNIIFLMPLIPVLIQKLPYNYGQEIAWISPRKSQRRQRQAIDVLYNIDYDRTFNFQTTNYYRYVNDNWLNQKKSIWFPFNDNSTKVFLEAAPHTITNKHRCLFLEDFMLMDTGSTILYLITKDHPLMQYHSPQSKKLKITQKKKN